jgi:hypothetical protein
MLLLFLLLPQPVQASFTIEDLYRRMEETRVSRMDEAISLLPEDLLSNYALAYAGQAAQGSSFALPKAILFGEDARFVLSFNGSDRQAGGNQFEILQFDDASSRFELHAVVFPLKRDSAGRIVRGRKNPSDCIQCHDVDPRAIWSEYGRWTGMYGTGESERLTDEEEAGFLDYSRKNGASARYRHLKPRKFPEQDFSNFEQRPNLRLGMLFSRMAARRLDRIVRESEFGDRYRWLLLHQISRCGDLDYSEEAIRWKEILRRDLVKASFGAPPFERISLDDPAQVLHLFRLSMVDLNLAFPPTGRNGLYGDFTYFDGSARLPELLRGLLVAGLSEVAKLYPAIPARGYRGYKGSRVVRTDFDQRFVEIVDELAVARGDAATRADCDVILQKLRSALFERF